MGTGGHRRLKSQSQASSFGQRGNKTHWILVISTFREVRSHRQLGGFRNLAPKSCR